MRSRDLRTESSTPFSMAIEFGYNNRSYVHLVLECPGLRLTCLTNSGIHDVDNVVWLLWEGGEKGGGEDEREARRGAGKEVWRERGGRGRGKEVRVGGGEEGRDEGREGRR